MTKGIIIILAFFAAACFWSCSNDNPVTKNEEPTSNNYVKVVTAESGSLKFETWSATASSLRDGYNKIGFKVFENNQEKNSGFVKFFPKMYHWQSSPMHSTPIKAQYNYDNSSQLFTGYVVYTMHTDSSSFWYGFYNYNNQLQLDSAMFNVDYYPEAQVKGFSDFVAGVGYLITLVKPYSPQQGSNTFQCMLHRTIDYIYFEQIDDAHMYIMPWMGAMGHGSSGNIHPAYTSEGIYEGTVNFNMPGEWTVYDTVYYQNRKITPNIPPKFTFNP